jgi:hypothetical protein
MLHFSRVERENGCMAIRVIVHVLDDEPFVADIEELPAPSATCVHLKNPTTRDQKQVKWTVGAVQTVIFSMARITFIEVPIKSDIDVQIFVKDETRRY